MNDTRAEAFKKSEERAPTLQEKCLKAFNETTVPMTADDVAVITDETVLSIRPRITKMKQDGLITEHDKNGVNTSGRRASRWVLAA